MEQSLLDHKETGDAVKKGDYVLCRSVSVIMSRADYEFAVKEGCGITIYCGGSLPEVLVSPRNRLIS